MKRPPSIFKSFLSVYIALFRRTGGKFGGKMGAMGVLLLTTTGRKSKQQRTSPLGYIRDGENYVVSASNNGQPQNPGWYFNLKDDPHAVIEVGKDKINVTAEQADPEQKKRLWAQLISVAPRYGKYPEKTSRDIPMMILHPTK